MRELVFVPKALLRVPAIMGWIIVTAATLLLLHPEHAEAQLSAGRDLIVSMSQAGASPVATRANVAFVVTVSNIRSGAIGNPVSVNVSVPQGFTALSADPGVVSGFTCSFKGNSCSCTTAPMAGNTQKTFRISATAPSTISGTSQSFTLTAQVDPNGIVNEGDETNNSSSLNVSVQTRADLDVDLPNAAGQTLTTQVAPNLVYIVDVKNTGDRDAPNLLVRSTLPKDVAFVRVEENQLGNCVQNSTASNGALIVNCTLSSLPAGASRHVRIIGKVLGSVPDRVQVTFSANVDPNNSVPERNETDNTAFMITTLRATSDVQVTGTAVGQISTRGGVVVGQTVNTPFVTVTLTVKNNGPYQSAATTVRTAWPAGFSRFGTSCFDACNVPALASGQSTEVVTIGEHRLTGTVQITSTVDPNLALFDPIVSNNAITFSVAVP
jgi:uncharacterized repeat protein (TIGR01451 family)